MMPMTVDAIARLVRVTPKTVRAWIRDEGCPVVQEGAKGPGNGAQVDGARFAQWFAEYQGQRRHTAGDFFASHHPGRNPLRDLVDTYRRNALYAVADALREWADKPAAQGTLDYRKAGLTKAQARAVAWQAFGEVALVLAAYQTGGFDQTVQREFGGDLDDLMSLWTEGDFRTTWPEAMTPFPPRIRALIPPDLARQLDETEAGDAK